MMICVLYSSLFTNTASDDGEDQEKTMLVDNPLRSGDVTAETDDFPAIHETRADVVTVMFDDAHLPAFTVDPNNDADDVHGWGNVGEGGHSSFADVLRDPEAMEKSHPGHVFDTDNTYEVVLLNEGELFTEQALKDVDVLVIPMTFNGQYKNSEIDVIENFVKLGGGLLLIADHSSFPAQVDEIAMRFYVKWGNNVVTDHDDYTGPHNYWLIYEDNGKPGDDNMPANDVPGFENDPDKIYMITEDATTVQYYCSNAYTMENPAESRRVIVTDTDGSCNFQGEPACLAIPNGNCTGAGRAVFIPDCNVFGDTYDCDEDGLVDFWDEHNAEFGLGIIDWLAPRAYEVALIPGEKDPYTGLPKPLVYIYEPGESHTFDIEVWNLGLRGDVIELEIPEIPGNWSASLDISETSELGTREMEHVFLTVTAPLTNVTDGEFAIINVTATSTNDPENATDTIWTTNVIIVDIGFNVNWAVEKDLTEQKKLIVDPGKSVVATLGINNIGNINDTYRIDFKGVPSGWGINVDTTMHPEWTFDPKENSLKGISLSSYHFEENATGVSVFFTPPLDAKEGETAIITAIGESYLSKLSDQEAKGKHDDDLVLEVSAFRAIELDCDDPVRYVDPGKTVSFQISVQNNGNSRETVEIQMGQIMEKWTAMADMPTLILQARQRKTVTVTVEAPADALEGSRCVLEVEANMPSVGKVVDSISLTTIVNRYSSINASLDDSDYYRLDPGDKISLNITVNNLGNGISRAYFSMAQLPKDWIFTFYYEGLEVDSISMDPYEALQVRLDITVSKEALSDGIPETPGFDPYPIVINVSGDDNYDNILLAVQINRKASVSVYTTSDLEITEPGYWTLFYVCVKNNGNAWDEIILNIDDVPMDTDTSTKMEKKWEVFFTSVAVVEQISGVKDMEYIDFTSTIDIEGLPPTSGYEPNNTKEEMLELKELTLRLPRGGIAWVTITAEVPHYALSRDAGFNVTSFSYTSPSLKLPQLEFTVSIRNAELSIVGDIRVSDNVRPGKLVSVLVHIKNTGEIRAENVQIRLYEDGSEVATMPIRTILAGNTQMVAFTWKVPDKSRCDLKVVIDPDNLITEKNRRNNMKERSVSISSSSSLLLGLSIETLFFIVGAVTAILILGGVWLFLRRR